MGNVSHLVTRTAALQSSVENGLAEGVPAKDRQFVTALARGLFDELPGVRFLEQMRRHRRVKRMAAAMHHRVRHDGVTNQREVADQVQDLVADELVFEP